MPCFGVVADAVKEFFELHEKALAAIRYGAEDRARSIVIARWPPQDIGSELSGKRSEYQMVDVQPQPDSMTLTPPRWVSILVSGTAEVILVIITLVIIAAMWLPAYLASSGHHPGISETNHDDRPGFMLHH